MLSHSDLRRGAVAGLTRRRRRRAQKTRTSATLDLRGDDRQDASRPRVAPDGAVPKRRVSHHRDGQEQRKDAAGDLRLAAVVGRPVPGAHAL